MGSGDDGAGVTKAPPKKRMQTPKKVESGSSANRSNNGPEQSESREQVEREKPKIYVERGQAKSANRHGQRMVSTRSMRTTLV